LDFERGTCPAPTLLTLQEKQKISRWVDLGSPLDLNPEPKTEGRHLIEGRTRQTYSSDSSIPILTALLREEGGQLVLDYGAFDLDEGIEAGSLNVTVSIEVLDRAGHKNYETFVAIVQLSFDRINRIYMIFFFILLISYFKSTIIHLVSP
jgi:hypothetical protein